jgi:uncharacterized protein YndB with AHSA1/START domain
MTHEEFVIEFDRPVEEVFAYVDDDDKVKQWVGGLMETKRTTPGKPGVGSKFHQTLQVGKRTFEIDGELLAYEPNRRVKVKLDAGICEMEVIYTFEEIDGRTRLTYTCDSYYRKLFYRLLSPLTKRVGRRKLEEDFARLRNLLSAKSHPSTPVATVGLVNSKIPEHA